MSIAKKLMIQPVAGSVAPEGVDFDGTNDYLSKSTDLTGNADGKTFTFSAWVYIKKNQFSEDKTIPYTAYDATNGRTLYVVWISSSSQLQIQCRNSSGTLILVATATVSLKSTWAHILVSFNLNSANSGYCYVNDVSYSLSETTYSNAQIDLTVPNHFVGVNSTAASGETKGRLAHVYLDYTYRDLSNSANRRLFITDDLKPAANQASLSPILYLPMTDADTAHVNEGTGGNFTPNGTFATSQRGPNQYNCVASDFDGIGDYLSSAGGYTGKAFTYSFVFHGDTSGTVDPITTLYDSTSTDFIKVLYVEGSEIIRFYALEGGSSIVEIDVPVGPAGTANHVCGSFDLSDTGKRYFYVNGVLASPTYTTYSNTDLTLTTGTQYIGFDGASTYFDGVIGEFYFDTTYTDLSTNNPFWDADNNRPKPVRQVLEETGNTPRDALPLEASNAGTNLGTGGNFTVNSGPYTGARGGSEFWARSADFDGTTGYLSRGALSGVSDSKTVSMVFALKPDNLTNYHKVIETAELGFIVNTNNTKVEIGGFNSSVSQILLATNDTTLSIGQQYLVFVSFDLADTGKRNIIVNGSSASTWTTYTNDTLYLNSGTNSYIGSSRIPSQYMDGSLGLLYFTTSYIDFSQEANRLKFVDAFGYPIDLQPAIDAGDIPTPLIYMKFDDPSNLGLNSGTGGNFTVNGNITQGADVDPNA